MPRDRIYLDYNATAPLRPAARACVIEALDQYGNASSIHAEGRRARASVERARASVAALFGAPADGVTFTSGATEAAALALTPALSTGGDRTPVTRLLVSATEHPAVLKGHRFAPEAVERLAVGSDGVLDFAHLAEALGRRQGRAVLALQAANGETGIVQPVAKAAAMVHAAGGLLVCDATQGAGRVDCRLEAMDADILLASGHKLGGPQGAGAMVVRGEAIRIDAPLMRGGGQERGLRAGTENGPAIAGFGAAAREAAAGDEPARLRGLRDRLEAGLRTVVPGAVIFGEAAARLPNTTAFALPGLANDTLLIGLDLEGVAVSTGSACSSGKVSSSHVLEAMGVNAHLRGGMIRASLGWSSSMGDVERFLEALRRVAARMPSRPVRSAA